MEYIQSTKDKRKKYTKCYLLVETFEVIQNIEENNWKIQETSFQKKKNR